MSWQFMFTAGDADGDGDADCDGLADGDGLLGDAPGLAGGAALADDAAAPGVIDGVAAAHLNGAFPGSMARTNPAINPSATGIEIRIAVRCQRPRSRPRVGS
jgi:hypothetical protein